MLTFIFMLVSGWLVSSCLPRTDHVDSAILTWPLPRLISEPEDLPWTLVHRLLWVQLHIDLETGQSQSSMPPHSPVSGYIPHRLLLACGTEGQRPKKIKQNQKQQQQQQKNACPHRHLASFLLFSLFFLPLFSLNLVSRWKPFEKNRKP